LPFRVVQVEVARGIFIIEFLKDTPHAFFCNLD
jgi:hypothetical protein